MTIASPSTAAILLRGPETLYFLIVTASVAILLPLVASQRQYRKDARLVSEKLFVTMTGFRLLAIILLLILSCAPSFGAVEARFTLAPESRLPKWFSLPAGVDRSGISVQLIYLTPTREGDDAVLEMRDRRGQLLGSALARACWHPAMEAKKNKHGGFGADSYPHYRYIESQGGIEIVEHRKMEPVFRISDDADLKRSALEARHCNKG